MTLLSDSSPLSLPPSTYAQPIPVDTNGDMKIDLLAMTEASASDPSMPLTIWKNVWNASQPDSPLFDL
jgi:integrin alpha FG-GAP repeat containing protein 1